MRWSWAGLALWQLAWHALLPSPAGNENWTLAIFAVIPLLPLTTGVLRASHRSLVLGIFLVMLYFIVGVMEIWSNPDQRLAAIVQVVLACAYFLGVVLFNRPVQAAAD